MKRLLVVVFAFGGTACSTGPNAPAAGYSGVWKGAIIGEPTAVTVVTTTTQTDSGIVGSGSYITPAGNQTFQVTGTSSNPNIRFTLIFNDGTGLTFVGQYVTADSVSGVLQLAPSVGPPGMWMKRQ